VHGAEMGSGGEFSDEAQFQNRKRRHVPITENNKKKKKALL
jgi:hypothetical protein